MIFEIDTDKKCLRVSGVQYSFEMLAALGVGGYPVGAYFKILARDEDGRIWVERYDPPEEKD